jgi:acetylornithine deacetylase/succinyl-diaminopimelate desuccinylase-like protein
MHDWNALGDEAVELFRALLRLDTTNPPGNEVIAAELLAETFRADEIEPWIVERAPGRANLVARLPATVPDAQKKPPLLLAGHTDVVPADPSVWTHPPFAGEVADGWIWGRGAVDMKNMVTMSVMTAKILARAGGKRTRDLIVACVADEEEGCTYGSKFLVEEHPERVRAEYMLGEVGGFFQHIGGVTYMPLMVAEKGKVRMRMRATGPPGHGSIPHEENSLVRLARAIEKIGQGPLPHHKTKVVERFLKRIGATQPFPASVALPRLLSPALEPYVAKLLPDAATRRNFAAMLHNTASPTMASGSHKDNVIPAESVCELDGRTLPGQSADDLVRELRERVADPGIEFIVDSATDAVELDDPGGPLYDTIMNVVGDHAPDVVVLPYMVMGYTDAQYFSQLGTKCYGFSPLRIDDPDVKFSELFHGIDERASVDGFKWGLRVLHDVVEQFLSK